MLNPFLQDHPFLSLEIIGHNFGFVESLRSINEK